MSVTATSAWQAQILAAMQSQQLNHATTMQQIHYEIITDSNQNGQ